MSTSREQIRAAVFEFLQKNFLFDKDTQLPDDRSLFRTRIVDSTGILELIGFLEATYNVKFLDEELVAENFDSLGRISGFLERKLAHARGGTGAFA